jgi:ABC-type methionine transport system ATPase subunit
MGISGKPAQAAVDGVLEFAEVQEFADEPVKNYSSGMQARLGFACATAFRPDILLIDEVLAVGDENFQRKCTAKMHEMKRAGTAIVLVSHDLLAVERFCERAYVLDHGNNVFNGNSAEAVAHFRSLLLSAENEKNAANLLARNPEASAVSSIECLVAGEGQASLVATGDAWSVTVTASGERLEGLTAGISILESSTETHLGGLMAEMASSRNGLVESEPQKGKRQWVFNFRTNPNLFFTNSDKISITNRFHSESYIQVNFDSEIVSLHLRLITKHLDSFGVIISNPYNIVF